MSVFLPTFSVSRSRGRISHLLRFYTIDSVLRDGKGDAFDKLVETRESSGYVVKFTVGNCLDNSVRRQKE